MPEADDAGAAPAAGLSDEIERLVGPVLSLTPVTGDAAGTGSRSFVAVTGSGEYHVKQIFPGMPRLLSLTEEYALLDGLAADGICPRPVAIDAGVGLIVSEQLRGYRSLRSFELREGATLARLADLLRRLHDSSAELAAHRAASIAERYVADAGGVDALDGAERERALEFLALAQMFDEREDPRVVCHGDIVASNVMCGPSRGGADAHDGRNRMLLIDFEYAQSAPAVFDLAGLSVMNEFAPMDDTRLLRQYFAGAEPPFSRDDFAKVRRLVTLLAHFWARGQRDKVPGVDRFGLDAERCE